MNVVRSPWSVVGMMLSAMLFALCPFAEAQQPKGYLSLGNPASASARAEGIRLARREAMLMGPYGREDLLVFRSFIRLR